MANGTSGTRNGGAANNAAPKQQATSSAPETLQKYSAWDENANYRNGIPYALRKQLEADGWEMDGPAVTMEAKDGDSIEYLDVQTGETFTYKKVFEKEINEFSGNEYTVSRYTMTSGESSEMPYKFQTLGEDGWVSVPNGIVAREKKKK